MELDPADGQQYINELRERLLELISSQQSIEDVEDRMRKLYPHSQVIELALEEAGKSRNDSTLKTLKIRNHSSSSGASFTGALHNITSFAVAKVSNLVKSENEVDRFKLTFIEFIIGEVIKLAAGFVGRQKNFIITRNDIRTAMHADKDLVDIFLSDDKSLLLMSNHPIFAHILTSTDKASQTSHNQELSKTTYKRKLRDMIDSENSFIRGLKLIMKIFRVQMKSQIEALFLPIRDIDDLFCNVDDLLDLSTQVLTIFDDALESVGQNDRDIPYVGAEIFELAQAEEFHSYFTFAHRRLSKKENWRRAYLDLVTNEAFMASIRNIYPSFDLAVKHLLPNYLLNAVVQFFEYYKNFNDLYELSKRHHNVDDQLALKETLSIMIRTKRGIESLLETAGKDGFGQKGFEPLDSKTAETIRATLERKLDAQLEHERNLPLPFMPPPEIYRFSEPDSKENIQFEEYNNHRTLSSKDIDKHSRAEIDHIPVIRCATLTKLVERLTYHKYQPNIVDSFLTTYRSFISDPEELLDLLIERYKIPDPPINIVCPDFHGPSDETTYKQYLKRFRQEYTKPVKMRVINVLKSWIKNHYYDFERHPTLLDKLNYFLDEIYNNDKVLRSLIVSIKKLIHQKRTSQNSEFEFMLSNEPPEILWWTAKANESEKFDILTLHPVEFARQLTLIEFDIFRAIKPSELIDVRDFALKSRKEDKYESSPNLRKMTRHFTLISYWIRKCIVEAEDFDKRTAICNRAIVIMGALRDLNNFTGLLSIGSAIESAPIMRLSHTLKNLTSTSVKILENYRELNEEHQKKLQKELRQCNPPCIPYLGSYQTKLIHAKEGNKTFIDEVDTTTISPTLSNDEFHSFSSSPTTPISPRTPLPRTANLPYTASSTLENQFFGGCTISPRSSLQHNNNFNGFSSGQGSHSTSRSNLSTITLTTNSNLNLIGSINSPGCFATKSANGTLNQSNNTNNSNLQPPLTPVTPKMINFTKQRIRAGLVAEISNYQNPPYCLKVQPEIRRFIESIDSRITEFASSLGTRSPGYNQNGSIEEDGTLAITKRLDDYLFEQSERIEPKNCTKPPRSKSKLPECWKSPGIKPATATLAKHNNWLSSS